MTDSNNKPELRVMSTGHPVSNDNSRRKRSVVRSTPPLKPIVSEFQSDALEIEQRTPPRIARMTLYCVVALIAAAIVWASVSRVDMIVTAQGKFSNVDAVALNVVPIQRQVPIYVAVLRREAAFHIGKQGNNLMCVPYASLENFDQIEDLIAEYRRGKAEAGLAPSDDDAVVTLHTHVAESDEAARQNAETAFNLYVDTRLYARKSTYDDAMRNGLHLFGSVETVTEKLAALHRFGVRHVSTLQNFGLMPQHLVRASMELLVREVRPRLMDRVQRAPSPTR